MGFSGGGSNVLKPHKHSSAVQDGSPLNMNNVTEATLSAGDVIFSNGAALQRLAIGTPAQQIKVNAGATAPEYFTPSAAASTWVTILDEYDTVASNNLDTGYHDFGSYRVVKYFWSARYSSGVDALDVRFYNPDGNEETSANQGCSGFFNSGTFFARGNETSYNLTNANVIEDDADIVMEITVLCASAANKGGGGYYTLSQRSATASGDATYCSGNLFQAHNSGLTSTDRMYFNGIKNISSNVFSDGILTVLGMGDNTS